MKKQTFTTAMSPEEILKKLKEQDPLKLYNLNKGSLSKEIVEIFEKNYDSFYFMFNVFVPFMADLPELIKELMLKHYPAFREETRPGIVNELDRINKKVGVDLIMGIGFILNVKKNGESMCEYLKPFEKWFEDCSPTEQKFEKVEESERIEFGSPYDERCAEDKKKENAFRHDEIEWINKRRFEFIDLLQSTLLKYFKGVELFNSDDLTYYSLLLRTEYEDFRGACENIENFIDWGLPEEDIALNYIERCHKQVAMGNEKRCVVAKLRCRRVYGEEI